MFAQFCGTSLWFAGNGVMDDLVATFDLNATALGHLTSMVQFGFITGTLIFAILTIADRYSPSLVFLISAALGALFNGLMIWDGNTLYSLLTLRFVTGFFLAGIYPVGMKISADYYEKGLGKSLGYLVGALVVGTAFPHLVRGHLHDMPWTVVMLSTSSLAIIGGISIWLFVPDGPYRKPGQKLDLSAFFRVFKNQNLRSAAFGYFGHMWELYAFWAFVPVIILTYQSIHSSFEINISMLSFLIIASGGLTCVIGGYLSLRHGPQKIALIALMASCLCCLICPFILISTSPILFLLFLFFWGMTVIPDSPLFSTLVANNAKAHLKGTALTIVNCIGFAITIISIQILSYLHDLYSTPYIYWLLMIGPVAGIISIIKIKKTN